MRISHSRRYRIVIAVTGVFLSALSCTSQAQIVVQSVFNASAEGWTATTFGPVCTTLASPVSSNLIWIASGGAPSGYIRTNDSTNTTFWRAPIQFRGNKSAAAGGSIQFEQRLTVSDGAQPELYYALDDVYIQSPSMTLIADAANPSRDAWGRTIIPLKPGHWRVGACNGPQATAAEINAVLANIIELYIRAENVDGGEVNELDNVVIDATPSDEGCPARWEERDVEGPTGRWRHAIAVDTARNIMVLFGGDTGETDTWEYNLANGVWTRIQPAVGPSRRGGHAMAYDTARGKVVLTGGGYLNTRFSEVWEYDTQTDTWSLATPLPQTRAGHMMVYDTARQKLVLYGGRTGNAQGEFDVLERSSTSSSWIALPGGNGPGGPQLQSGAAMAYDSARERTVLVAAGTVNLEIYEWNGATSTWEPRNPSGPLPSRRGNPTAAYDASRSRVVVAGGQGTTGTFEYDGTNWSSRAAINAGGRDEHAMAYDPLNQRVLLSGGIVGLAGAGRDLLAFNGSANTWSTSWSRPQCSARDFMGIVYDEQAQRVVVYGGGLLRRADADRQFGGGVFTFDGSTWATPAVAGTPGTRWFVPLMYAPDRTTILAYGGSLGDEPSIAALSTGRLWELSTSAPATWVDRGFQTPGLRFDHAAAYDRLRGQMVVHGGVNDLDQRLGDTWIWTSATNSWTTLPPTALTPGVRARSAAVFDENRGVVVLFGGSVGLYDNQTWEWNGTDWRNATPLNGNPPSRLSPRLVYDPQRRRVVLFGGRANFNDEGTVEYSGRAYDDLWEWDGVRWSRVAQQPGSQPIGRVNGGAAYDRARGRIVYFGGSSVTNANYLHAQTWDLIMPDPTCGGPTCDSLDFNNDTSLFDPTDIDAFFSVFSEGPCIPTTATCNDLDFNNDGSLFDPCDIDSFMLVFSEGPCTLCGV